MQCAASDFLCHLNQYSNLILGAVTIAYVILTWRMVTEMRRARESESEPQLISTLVPLGAMRVKLRIQNVGLGPALQIAAQIQLQPESGEAAIWQQPALISGAFQDFLIPDKWTDQVPSFQQVAARYQKLIIRLEWSNVFGCKRHVTHEIDLQQLEHGWFSRYRLVQPDDLAEQLEAIRKELQGIRDELAKPNDERVRAELLKDVSDRRKPVYRIIKWCRTLIGKIWQGQQTA